MPNLLPLIYTAMALASASAICSILALIFRNKNYPKIRPFLIATTTFSLIGAGIAFLITKMI